MADVLEDLLQTGLHLVLCGTQAGRRSASAGAYYANPANKFWRILHETGMTPTRIAPQDYRLLLQARIGLTDLAKGTSGQDSDIRREHWQLERFREAIIRYQPALLAFTSKKAAQIAYGLGSTAGLDYGRQPASIGPAETWVLPSTSGAGGRYWNSSPWHDLGRRFREVSRHAAA